MDRKELIELVSKAKVASRQMVACGDEMKKRALGAIADAIMEHAGDIKFKNEIDVEAARQAGLPEPMIDRLTLTDGRIEEMANATREIAELPDPVGETVEELRPPNGLVIRKVRMPIGVIGIIYESRPNVTVEASALCIKSGNCVVLRGGSEALNSNLEIAKILSEAGIRTGLPEGVVTIIPSSDRALVDEMIKMDGLIDVLIPRGSEEFVRHVQSASSIPVIGHGKGVCHTYVHEDADLEMAQDICFNAKVQRPGVCNAMETMLVHSGVADKFLPQMLERFRNAGVEIRGCERTKKIVSWVNPAVEEDWSKEYLALILAVKLVDSVDEAIEHVNRYGSGHSDAIVCKDENVARKFLVEVDSGSCFWNASTRLADGGIYGFGAEIGISNAKIHCRGPMGVKDLTTPKYIVFGKGQIRS